MEPLLRLILLAWPWRRVPVIVCGLCGSLVADEHRERHALAHDLQTR